MTEPVDESDRLRSRLERERRARRQAEVIAERGMRELWEANRELQARVARRTAELERLVDGLEYAQAARLRAIGDLADDVAADIAAERGEEGPRGVPGAERLRHAVGAIDEIRLLAAATGPSKDAAAVECRPTEIADRLIERWQRPAARQGQLLTVEVGSSSELARIRWSQVMAIADVVVGGFVRHGGPGGLSAIITIDTDAVVLEVHGSVHGTTEDSDDARRGLGTVGADLALADRMVRSTGGSLEVRRAVGGALEVRASLRDA